MMKNSTSLFAREKSFIKVSYEHPGDIHSLADGHEVVPKVGTLGMVRASIDTSAGSGHITTANFYCYGELVRVKDGGGGVACRMLKEPNSSRMTVSFYDVYRCVAHIRPKN